MDTICLIEDDTKSFSELDAQELIFTCENRYMKEMGRSVDENKCTSMNQSSTKAGNADTNKKFEEQLRDKCENIFGWAQAPAFLALLSFIWFCIVSEIAVYFIAGLAILVFLICALLQRILRKCFGEQPKICRCIGMSAGIIWVMIVRFVFRIFCCMPCHIEIP